MIVKVMNSALVDEKVAMVLLPLTTIIYRVGGVVMECVTEYGEGEGGPLSGIYIIIVSIKILCISFRIRINPGKIHCTYS